jgi:transposase
MQQLGFDGNPVETATKKRQKHKGPSFRPGTTNQTTFLYGDLTEIVGPFHIARFISAVVDRMDLSTIYAQYKGGGNSAYDVGMMLKAWLLGYHYGIYTSRPLELYLHESMPFIWIAGGRRPDFWTLSMFRKRLEDDIKEIFKSVVQHALIMGAIDGEKLTVDGTIITANAHRYRVIWSRWVKKQTSKVKEELDRMADEITADANRLQEEEDARFGDSNGAAELRRELDEETLTAIAREIEAKLKGKRGKTEEEQGAYDRAKRVQVLVERNQKLQEQESALDGKNSCARHDHDAPAVMNKDGIIRPGYTEMIASQNGFVVNYETGNVGERSLFTATVAGSEKNTGQAVKKVSADGGFGNEENLDYLAGKNICGYVPYHEFYQERRKKWREKVQLKDFQIDMENKTCRCPAGKELLWEGYRRTKTASGYERVAARFKAQPADCAGCALKGKCTNAQARSIEFSENYERLKDEMRKKLRSEEGRMVMRRRGCEVETDFGQRKWNKRNRRFWLKGLRKVNIESGLMYTTQNLAKLWRYVMNRYGLPPVPRALPA